MSSQHMKKNAETLVRRLAQTTNKKWGKPEKIRWHMENKQLFGPVCKPSNVRVLNPKTGQRMKLVSAVEKESRVKKYVQQSMLKTANKEINDSDSSSFPERKLEASSSQKLVGIEDIPLTRNSHNIYSTDYNETLKNSVPNSLTNVASFLFHNQQEMPNSDLSLTGLNASELANLEIKPRSKKKKVSVKHTFPLKYIKGGLSEERNTEKSEFPTFPLYNTWEDKYESSMLSHFETQKQQFSVGQPTVPLSHILEVTCSSPMVASQHLGSLKSKGADTEVLTNSLSQFMVENFQRKTLLAFPDPTLPVHLFGFWKSMKEVLKTIDEVLGVDVVTVHPVLGYTTTADVICSYNGNLVLMDWKSQFTILSAFTDRTLQAAACLGALNFDPKITFKKPIKSATIIVSFSSGAPGYVLNIKENTVWKCWMRWMQRWQSFHEQYNLKNHNVQET